MVVYRKWYGNYDDVVNWENDGERLQTDLHESGRVRAVNLNLSYIFSEGLSWTSITSGSFSIRLLPVGGFYLALHQMLCSQMAIQIVSLLNSKVHDYLGKVFELTLNVNPGDVGKFQFLENFHTLEVPTSELVKISAWIGTL